MFLKKIGGWGWGCQVLLYPKQLNYLLLLEISLKSFYLPGFQTVLPDPNKQKSLIAKTWVILVGVNTIEIQQICIRNSAITFSVHYVMAKKRMCRSIAPWLISKRDSSLSHNYSLQSIVGCTLCRWNKWLYTCRKKSVDLSPGLDV